MVRILITDDHMLFRQVVREVLEKEADLEVVAEAANGEEAIQQAEVVRPDVILMDLTMPVCDGFEATRRILAQSPNVRVVIFSASSEDRHLLQALQSGAIGYITKDTGPRELVAAIYRAAQNELYLAPSLAARLLALLRTLKIEPPTQERRASLPPRPKRPRPKKDKRNWPLSKREQEVLDLIRQGQRDREIARSLRVAESTVHKHVQNIFEKLNARNRAEALFLSKG